MTTPNHNFLCILAALAGIVGCILGLLWLLRCTWHTVNPPTAKPHRDTGVFTCLPEITPHMAARRDLMRQNIFNALNNNKTAH